MKAVKIETHRARRDRRHRAENRRHFAASARAHLSDGFSPEGFAIVSWQKDGSWRCTYCSAPIGVQDIVSFTSTALTRQIAMDDTNAQIERYFGRFDDA